MKILNYKDPNFISFCKIKPTGKKVFTLATFLKLRYNPREKKVFLRMKLEKKKKFGLTLKKIIF